MISWCIKNKKGRYVKRKEDGYCMLSGAALYKTEKSAIRALDKMQSDEYVVKVEIKATP